MKRSYLILLQILYGLFASGSDAQNGNAAGFSVLRGILLKTAAYACFILCVTTISLCSIAVRFLCGISNHGVLTLDILCILTTLFLVAYHRIQNQTASSAECAMA